MQVKIVYWGPEQAGKSRAMAMANSMARELMRFIVSGAFCPGWGIHNKMRILLLCLHNGQETQRSPRDCVFHRSQLRVPTG